MTRVLSALVLLPLVAAAILYLPPAGLLAVAEVVLWLAFLEYARMAEALGVRVPRVLGGTAAAATCAAVAWQGGATPAVLMTAVIATCAVAVASGRIGADVLAEIIASLFASLYLGLPLGAIVATSALAGPEAVLLLILTVAASDTAQFYTGSMFGRRRLAPVISPKKSVEGAIGGFIGGPLALAAIGHWWLPAVPAGWCVALGVIVVATGILGDLFESQIKRTSGVKDSSALIPGHGGVLDRIDALLFAAPAYYLFLRYWM